MVFGFDVSTLNDRRFVHGIASSCVSQPPASAQTSAAATVGTGVVSSASFVHSTSHASLDKVAIQQRAYTAAYSATTEVHTRHTYARRQPDRQTDGQTEILKHRQVGSQPERCT